MQKAYANIEAEVERVRRRRVTLRRLRASFIFLFAFTAIFTLALFLLPSLDGWLRVGARVAALASLFIGLVAWAAGLAYVRETADSAARSIERANPHASNDLINAVQLTRAMDDPGPAGSFSRALFEKHLEKTSELMPELDLAAAAPARVLKRPAALAAAAGLVLLTLCVLFPDRAGLGASSLFTDSFKPGETADQAALPLTLGDFTLSYQFPEYSGIEPQTVAHANGDVAALKGTVVAIQTSSLEPLRSASLITSAGTSYAMEVEDETTLKTELALSEAGTYFIEGVGKKGEKRAEPASHRLLVDEDLPPRVSLLIPAADLEIAAEDNLPLTYEASDDFGLSRTELVYQRGGKETRLPILSFKGADKKELKDEHEWPLGPEKFQPGDRIAFFIEVTDNDEVSGGKSARSDTRVLEIFSARKEHRRLLARQDELLDAMIDHLASHLVSFLDDRAPGVDALPSEKKMLAQASELVSFIRGLRSEIEEDELAEELVMDALSEMAARYSALIGERSQLIEGLSELSGPAREILFGLQDDYRAGLEFDIVYLDKLVKKQRVDDLMEEADDLYKARADLASLLDEYKRTGDPALLEELRQKLEELQEAFANLQRRMAEARKGMPEEFVNAEAASDESLGGLAEEMEKLRKALADGDVEDVMDMADRFLDMMDQWMTGLEESATELSDVMSREMMRELGEFTDRVSDMAQRQKHIEEGLRELYEGAMQNSPEREAFENAKSEVAQKLAEADSSINDAMNAMSSLKPGGSRGYRSLTRKQWEERRAASSSLNSIRRELKNAREDLANNEFEKALQTTRAMREKLERTRDFIEEAAERDDAGPKKHRENFQGSCDRAGGSMAGAIEGMEELMESSSVSLSPEGQSMLEELSGLQEAVRQDAQRTMQEYGEFRERVSSLPESVGQDLESAGQKMRDALGEISAADPAGAMTPARDARKHLEQALDGLNNAKSKMGQGMMMGSGSMSMPSGRSSRKGEDGREGMNEENFELPDEDLYKVPEEFREQLLRAMKEDSPEAYKNLNKDYYERLVR